MMERLAKIGLVDYVAEGEAVSSTVLGETVSRNCASIETASLICESAKTSFRELLELLSQVKENERFRVKNEERKMLNQMNSKEDIRYPIKGVVNTYDKKCFLLYQAAMSCTRLCSSTIRDRDRELDAEERAGGVAIALMEDTELRRETFPPSKEC